MKFPQCKTCAWSDCHNCPVERELASDAMKDMFGEESEYLDEDMGDK